MSQHSHNLILSLRAKYEAQKIEAFTHFKIYTDDNRISAIGEHSNILSECDMWLTKYQDAVDKLESLDKLINDKI
jgi:hypothetical protein